VRRSKAPKAAPHQKHHLTLLSGVLTYTYIVGITGSQWDLHTRKCVTGHQVLRKLWIVKDFLLRLQESRITQC